MNFGVGSHLQELENEAADAEREYEELRERHERTIQDLNQEVSNVVARVSAEKARLKEILGRKEHWVRKKQEEVEKFKEAAFPDTVAGASIRKPSSARPSIARNSLVTHDDIKENGFTPVNGHNSEHADPPKNAVKSVPAPQEPSAATRNHLPAKYLNEYPIIIRNPNGSGWLEIRCMLCNGNWIDKKGWIRGARGMLAHANKSHKVDTFGGKKLDSTNILEFCTHRTVTEEEVTQILDGKQIPEAVVCREATNTDQRFAASTPKVTKANANGTPNSKGVVLEHEESDQPYDWLMKYPTIVLRKDNTWVELRCDVCGGNSLANSDKRFAQGVIGFVRHLSRGHGVKPDKPNGRLDWALNRCTFREVPQSEIEAWTENHDGAPAPPEKVPFKQTVNIRDSLGSEFTPTTKRPRAAKRASEMIEPSDPEDDTDLDADLADSDFDPNGRDLVPEAKRPRTSIATSSPKAVPTRAAKKAKTILDAPTSPTSGSPASKMDMLMRYCPCTIGGHPCSSPKCELIKICTNSHHDDDCRSSDMSHDLKPTCVMAILGTECPDGDACNRAHDSLDERRQIASTHLCKDH